MNSWRSGHTEDWGIGSQFMIKLCYTVGVVLSNLEKYPENTSIYCKCGS